MSARVVWPVVVLVTLLAGCSGQTAPPAPPVTPAAAGGDPSSCVQGRCQVRVSGPVSIPLDPRFGLIGLRVESVGSGTLTLVATLSAGLTGAASNEGYCGMDLATGSGGKPRTLRATCDSGATVILPTITINSVALGPGVALLRLSPR